LAALHRWASARAGVFGIRELRGLLDAELRQVEGPIDVAEGVVRPDPGVERLRRVRRHVPEGAAHLLDGHAAVLRYLRERRAERLQREGHAASSRELAFQLAEHGVGPRPDLAAHAAVRHEPFTFSALQVVRSFREEILEDGTGHRRDWGEVRGGPRLLALRMGDEDPTLCQVDVLQSGKPELLWP